MKKEEYRFEQLSLDFTAGYEENRADYMEVRIYDLKNIRAINDRKRELEIIRKKVKSVELFFK